MVATSEARVAADAGRVGPLADVTSVAIVVLSSVQPFAAFLAVNATKLVHPWRVVLVALVWTVVAVGGFLLARLATRRRAPLAVAAAVAAFNVSFWNFSRWLPWEPASAVNGAVSLLLWLVVTAALVRLAIALARWSSAGTFLLLMFAIWTAGSAVTYASARTSMGGDAPTTDGAPAFPAFTQHPDVYWFVLDEHANAAQVERWTGVDTTWFTDDLADRGFSTSSSSHANYVFTHLSIPSTLTMDLPFTPGHAYHDDLSIAVPFLAGDNPVVETFEANGYRYVFAPDGSMEWAGCPTMSGDRVCIEPEGSLLAMRGPQTELVRSTPLGLAGLPLVHNDVDSVIDGVEAVEAEDPDRPLFTFAHVLSPHYPFRYEDGCAERGRWTEGVALTGEERAAAYANEVSCVDRDVLAGVDRILADDPDAVIVIQGDHGSTLSFNWAKPYDEWTGANLSERFGALNAMRLPEGCRGRSIEGQPLVNTFRMVFGCLSGTEPELLDTRLFWSDPKLAELHEVPLERLDDPSG